MLRSNRNHNRKCKEERSNLIGIHFMGNELKSKLKKRVVTTKKDMQDNRQEIDKETVRKLHSLGYIR